MAEKIPLQELIAIAELEAMACKANNARAVQSRRMSEDQARLHADALDQIVWVLRWFERWEQPIRDAVLKRQADVREIERLKEDDPAVAAVAEAWPDASFNLLEPTQ